DIKPLSSKFYCDTLEYPATQCDSPFMGLPFPNQTELQWCLIIRNQFNNSQKAYVSFGPDGTSTNANNFD
ncbi:20516_t:CDS:1, partial [Racocetra persica]